MKTFVLWSTIMTPAYNTVHHTSSSAIVESYFHDVKNRIFKCHNIPIRCDKFIAIHVEDIKGALAVADYQTPTFVARNVTFDDEETDIEQKGEIIENWKNLGIENKPKKVRTSYYNTPCPEITTVKEGKKVKLPLLRNGNFFSQPVVIAKELYMFNNTCALDTVLQIIASSMCDSPDYKEAFFQSDLQCKDFFAYFTSRGSANKVLYKKGENF